MTDTVPRPRDGEKLGEPDPQDSLLLCAPLRIEAI